MVSVLWVNNALYTQVGYDSEQDLEDSILSRDLEQPLHLSGFGVHVDVAEGGIRRRARH